MPSQFKCPPYNSSHAYCIASSHKCDGKQDCPGGEDEMDCPVLSCSADWFSCNNSKCIPEVRLWKGIVRLRLILVELLGVPVFIKV